MANRRAAPRGRWLAALLLAAAAEPGRADVPADPRAPLEIVALDVSPGIVTLLPGETVRLLVVARMEDGTSRDVTAECTYESADESRATVAPGGTVGAVAAGRVSIRVEHPSGRRARREADVWVGTLVDIGLTPTVRTIAAGESIAMRALAIYDNGRSRDVTEEVKWASSDVRVVVVSDDAGARGRATGVAPGSAVVVAHDPASGVRSRPSSGAIAVTAERGTGARL